MIQPLMAIMFLTFGLGFIVFALGGSQPAVTSQLSAGIVVGDGTIPVTTIEGMPSSGVALIGDEFLGYTATTSSCPAPFEAQPACLTGVSRGVLQTSAKSHSAGSRVYSELSGGVNAAAGFESVTNIDDLGTSSSPLAFAKNMLSVLGSAKGITLNMFTGDFGIVGMVIAMIMSACILGLGYILWGLVRGGK